MPHNTRVVAIANQKGGVGKTTTAINFAASLAHYGQRTLVIDLDPQGNASSGLGFPKDHVEQGSLDVVLGRANLDDVIQNTLVEGLDLLPATRDLIGAEVELMQTTQRETRLQSALGSASSHYDWIILDCPPSLGFLTVNALVAADSVLIPVQAEYYALEGLGELLRTLSVVRKRLNSKLKREGIVLTLHDTRNNLCNMVEEQLRELFKDEVMDTVIPRNVRLGEAPSYGRPILAYDPSCWGARAYLSLAREVLAKYEISTLSRMEAV
jgi:chromosome partitioning protein